MVLKYGELMSVGTVHCGESGIHSSSDDSEDEGSGDCRPGDKAGVKGIWNFAHVDLNVPDGVVVENVHLSESLMRMSYRVCSMQDKGNEEKRPS